MSENPLDRTTCPVPLMRVLALTSRLEARPYLIGLTLQRSSNLSIQSGPDASAQCVGRVARLSRNVRRSIQRMLSEIEPILSSVSLGKRFQDLLCSADPREVGEDSLKGEPMLFHVLAGAGVFYYDKPEAQARPLTQR
jgi:hypothetical protein